MAQVRARGPSKIVLPRDETGARIRELLGGEPELTIPRDYDLSALGLARWLQTMILLAGARSTLDLNPERAASQESQRAAAEAAAAHLLGFVEDFHSDSDMVRLLEMAIELGRVVERWDAAEHGPGGIGPQRKQRDAGRASAAARLDKKPGLVEAMRRHWGEASRAGCAKVRWERLRALVAAELGPQSVHSIDALKKHAHSAGLRFGHIRKPAS